MKRKKEMCVEEKTTGVLIFPRSATPAGLTPDSPKSSSIHPPSHPPVVVCCIPICLIFFSLFFLFFTPSPFSPFAASASVHSSVRPSVRARLLASCLSLYTATSCLCTHKRRGLSAWQRLQAFRGFEATKKPDIQLESG